MALTLFLNINDISTDEYKRELGFLCDRKLKKVKNMCSQEDEKRSLAANLAARRAAACFLGLDEDDIRIYHDETGRPLCDGCFVSLSHSGEYAACAVDCSPVGIDIEHIRQLSLKLSDKICRNDGERSFADCSERLLELWTVKEACFKALSPKYKTVGEIELEIVENCLSLEEISFIETGKVHEDYLFSLAAV